MNPRQGSHWPLSFNPAISGGTADPDGDTFNNWHEYAFGLSPTNANPITTAPGFVWIEDGTQRFGSLGYTRYRPALDLDYGVEAAGAIIGPWTRLENVTTLEPNPDGLTERVTIRDTEPGSSPQRFLRLNVMPR